MVLVVDVFESIQKKTKNAKIVINDDPIIIHISDCTPSSPGLDRGMEKFRVRIPFSEPANARLLLCPRFLNPMKFRELEFVIHLCLEQGQAGGI